VNFIFSYIFKDDVKKYTDSIGYIFTKEEPIIITTEDISSSSTVEISGGSNA
jgi:hypothetical protein